MHHPRTFYIRTTPEIKATKAPHFPRINKDYYDSNVN